MLVRRLRSDDIYNQVRTLSDPRLLCSFPVLIPLFLKIASCVFCFACRACMRARLLERPEAVTPDHWTLKRLERCLVKSGLTTEWSRHGRSHVDQKHAWEKILLSFYFSWTVNSNKYAVRTTFSSTLLRTKKKTVKKSEIWVKFFAVGCVFYRVGDWDDLQIDPHVSLHNGFKKQFASIVPVFLELNAPDPPCRWSLPSAQQTRKQPFGAKFKRHSSVFSRRNLKFR